MAEKKIIPKKTKPKTLLFEHNRMLTKDEYKYTYTGKATTELMRVKKTADPGQIDLYGTARIKSESGDYVITIKGYEILDPNNNIKSQYPIKNIDLVLLRCLLTKLLEQHDPLISLPLSEYMELRGLRQTAENRKRTAAQVRESMKSLKRIEKMEYTERGKGWTDISLYGGTNKLEKGIIYFRVNPDAIDKAFNSRNSKKTIMPYHKALLSLNPQRDRHAFHLGEKLSVHKNMNYGEQNENIISVKSLLNTLPDMPRYEDVKGRKSGGHVTQRIIEPLVRAMDTLAEIGMLLSWEYSGVNGAPLEDPDPEKDYHTWIKTNVQFYLKNYPDRLLSDKKKKELKLEKSNQPPKDKT